MRYVRSRDPSPGCVRKACLPSCHQGTPTPVLAFLPTYWASSPCQPVPIEGGAHSVAGSLALGGEQAMLAGAISRGLLLLQVAVTAALAVGLLLLAALAGVRLLPAVALGAQEGFSAGHLDEGGAQALASRVEDGQGLLRSVYNRSQTREEGRIAD